MLKRMSAIIVILAMLLCIFVGCGNTPASISVSEDIAVEEAVTSKTTETSASEEELSYFPLEKTEDLSLWCFYPPLFSEGTTAADYLVFTESASRLNINLDVQCANVIVAGEQLNLMLASGAYTDMLFNFDMFYNGGVSAAYTDGIIVDLTDLIPQYAPDYNAYRNVNEMTAASTTTNGQLLQFYVLYDGNGEPQDSGPMIRKDWLDALNLEMPTTYDDCYNVLKQFKDEYNATLDLGYNGAVTDFFFTSGFDTVIPEEGAGAFYQIDGVVQYGPTSEGTREYLTLMNQWYNEGLINPDFMVNNGSSIPDDTEIASGKVGIWNGLAAQIDHYTEVIEGTGDVRAMPDLLREEGQTLHMRPEGSPLGVASVTDLCQNPELAVRFLNWWFTEEGIELANYGVEGYTYERNDDGSICWSNELILNNQELNDDQTACLSFYTAYRNTVPFLYDCDRFETMYSERQAETADIWTSHDDFAYGIPSSFSLSAENTETVAAIYNDIETYVEENIVKFIIGERSLDEFDDFVQQINNMGIQDVLDIYTDTFQKTYG